MRNEPFRLTIASGKGGVGKSLVTSTLAYMLREKYRIIIGDCDADTPNQRVYFSNYIYDKKTRKIKTEEKAFVNEDLCDNCKKCAVCPYNAITFDKKAKINSLLCEGCNLCGIVCPRKAIKLKLIENAEIQKFDTTLGFKIISGQLYPGMSGSGKIVDEIKKEVEKTAKKEKTDLIIHDSAAGIGCPVIASIRNADYVILVTEPTPSAFNDMKRTYKIVKSFNIEAGVIINNSNYDEEIKNKIINYASQENIKLLGTIPHDKRFIEAITRLKISVEYDDELKRYFKESIKEIEERLQQS